MTKANSGEEKKDDWGEWILGKSDWKKWAMDEGFEWKRTSANTLRRLDNENFENDEGFYGDCKENSKKLTFWKIPLYPLPPRYLSNQNKLIRTRSINSLFEAYSVESLVNLSLLSCKHFEKNL
jgi:hypothetical protein